MVENSKKFLLSEDTGTTHYEYLYCKVYSMLQYNSCIVTWGEQEERREICSVMGAKKLLLFIWESTVVGVWLKRWRTIIFARSSWEWEWKCYGWKE